MLSPGFSQTSPKQIVGKELEISLKIRTGVEICILFKDEFSRDGTGLERTDLLHLKK